MTPWLVALPVVVAAATASPSSPSSRTVVTCLDAHGTVRLSRPRTCPGRRTKAYTRIAVRPAGQKQASVVALAGCG